MHEQATCVQFELDVWFELMQTVAMILALWVVRNCIKGKNAKGKFKEALSYLLFTCCSLYVGHPMDSVVCVLMLLRLWTAFSVSFAPCGVVLLFWTRCALLLRARSMCYKDTRWLGMHKQTGTRAGNHQRHTHTRRTSAHQRRPTTVHETQTAIPRLYRCTCMEPTHHTHI